MDAVRYDVSGERGLRRDDGGCGSRRFRMKARKVVGKD